MKAKYDKEAKALYVKVLEGEYKLTTEEFADDILIDRTPLQEIYGIDFLNVELEIV